MTGHVLGWLTGITLYFLNVSTLPTSTFKLATLRAHTGLRGAVLGSGNAKVLGGLTSGTLSTQQDRLLTLGSTQGQLIQREGLTTGLHDAGTSRLGEFQSSHGHLGDHLEALIIGDRSNNDGQRSILTLGHILGDGRDGEGRTVSLAHA